MKTIIEKDKSIDIDQLHEAITEFQSTVDKLKHAQRLENYHKHYMSIVKSKARSIQASHLSRVHELIPPGIGTDHNFNIYSYLNLKSRSHRISLPIIETLCIDYQKVSHLFNTHIGIIKSETSDFSYLNFLNNLNQSDDESHPLLIFKSTSGKKRLFYTLSDFQNNWETINQKSGFIQKFIKTREDRVFIFRTHWKEGDIIKGYTIGKKRKKPDLLKTKKKSVEKKSSLDEEGYLERAKDILQQIRIKDNRQMSLFSTESFVPLRKFEEELSLDQPDLIENEPSDLAGSLKEKLERKFSLPWGDEKDEIKTFFLNKEPDDNFLVTGRNPDHSYFNEVRNIDSSLIFMTKKLVKYLKLDKKHLKEATFDFIKDPEKSWLLLNCEKISFEEDSKSFQEIVLPVSHHASIIPASRNQSFCFTETNVETKTNTLETPPMSEAIPTSQGKRTSKALVKSLKNTRSQCFNDRYKRVVKRLEDLPVKNHSDLNNDSKKMIKIYENSFSSSILNRPERKRVKKQDSFKIGNSETGDDDPDFTAKSMKTIIRDYDQMMIHVRRLNLEKKKPLIEVYGGEIFWTRVLKSLYKELIENPFLQSSFTGVTKEQFKNISKGLQCIFNSNTPIEFRRIVRAVHKPMSITSKEFYSFRNIFLQVLKDNKVASQHLEIIQDNVNSFYSAIVKVS